jgi:hypothetical protein
MNILLVEVTDELLIGAKEKIILEKIILRLLMNHNDYPSLDALFGRYDHCAQDCLNNLDFNALSVVRSKILEDLN